MLKLPRSFKSKELEPVLLSLERNAGDEWKEIGRTTLSANADSISVLDFKSKKFLKIVACLVDTGGNLTADLTFNSDTGNNYSQITSSDFAAGAPSTSRANFQFYGAGRGQSLIELRVTNISDEEKMAYGFASRSAVATGAGTAPTVLHLSGKWANTSSQIKSVTITNTSTGDYEAGKTTLIVYGHD